MEIKIIDGTEKVKIGERWYSERNLIGIIKRNITMDFDSGDEYCPLCGCYLQDNDLFVCDICGQLYDIDEMCTDHHDKEEKICIYCCEECDHSDEIDDDMGEEPTWQKR